MDKYHWRTAALVAALGTIGCGAVRADVGFNEVGRAVEERAGSRVHWDRGTEADRAAESEVASLLAKELDANSAVQVALLENRDLQATFERLNIAQADLVAAGLLRNPVFDADIRFATEGGGTGMELAVVQNFIDILYIPLRKRVAGTAFEAAKLDVTGEVIHLAGRVRASFYAAQAAEQTLELRRTVLASTEATYAIARRLREAGNITALDLENERAMFEQSKLDVRSAELELLRARERVNELLGLWGEHTAWKTSPRLPDPRAEEQDPSALEGRAVERSLDLAIARNEVEQAAASLGIARPFDILADAGVGATAERESEGTWGVGPAFSLPIPIFNQGQPAVAAAQAGLRAATKRYEALAVGLRSRVRAAHGAVQAARDRVQYYSRVILPLRARILEHTQLQYNAMQVGPFQLLQARRDQIDAGAAYVAALLDYWLAHTEREQLLSGRMTGLGVEGISNGGAAGEARQARGGH